MAGNRHHLAVYRWPASRVDGIVMGVIETLPSPRAIRSAGLGLLSLTHLVDDVYQGALPAMLPYLVADRHVSLAAAGSLVFAANLTSSVGQPFYGYLADAGKARWLSPAGLAAAGVGIGLTGVLHGFWWIFAAVAISGIGVDAYHPGAAREAHRASAGRRSASRFSLYSLGGNVGFAIGPLLALPLLVVWGLNGMAALAIPALAVAVVFARYMPATAPSSPARSASGPSSSAPSPPAGTSPASPATPDRWAPFSLVTVAVLSRSVAFFGITTFLPLWWVRHLHHSKPAADAAVTAFMCAGIAGTLIGGRLADRYGRKRVAAIGLAAATPLMLAYLAMASYPAAFLLLIPAGIALYIPFSIMVSLGQRFLPNRVGVASGVTLGLAASAGGITAPLLGWIAAGSGLTVTLIAVSCVPLLAAIAPALLPADS
jgi:FSR family fosmidomycin resistance protein-like MFS transporter